MCQYTRISALSLLACMYIDLIITKCIEVPCNFCAKDCNSQEIDLQLPSAAHWSTVAAQAAFGVWSSGELCGAAWSALQGTAQLGAMIDFPHAYTDIHTQTITDTITYIYIYSTEAYLHMFK